MRMSYWGSDVCSSDLSAGLQRLPADRARRPRPGHHPGRGPRAVLPPRPRDAHGEPRQRHPRQLQQGSLTMLFQVRMDVEIPADLPADVANDIKDREKRSEERREGKECVRTDKTRGAAYA